jgi:TetR/AcrR family transcriptional regulator, mexJK operon transcriptional repressor
MPSKIEVTRPKARPRLRLQPRRPRGRPKADDVEALEARLVSVARQAFVLHGYGATSINAIAKSARVSKNTLYARFPSKAALFQTIIAQQIASVDAELGPGADSRTLEDALRTFIEVALRTSLNKEGLEINRLIMAEAYQFPEIGQAARDRFQVGIANVARIIEAYAKRDRMPCRNASAAAEVFLYAVYGWYTFAVTTNRPGIDQERVPWIDNVIRIFLAGRAEW